jgi:DNA polymerase zeta
MMEPLNQVEWAKNEVSVFQKLLEVFREYDPDILVGFETETQSIGYICKRGEALTIQLATMLSRVPVTLRPLNESYYNQRLLQRANEFGVDDQIPNKQNTKNKYTYFNQKWGQAVKINGRVIINLWRIVASEINLTNYDFDNVCFHILKR